MFTLYSADFINAPSNCSYPHKFEVTDSVNFADAVSRDYVCAEYMNNYRNGDNFLGSDCLPVDCDNDHSENPADWVTPADVQAAFPGITFAVHYSRFHMREKNGKPARPKFHVLFPIEYMTDAAAYSEMKKLVNTIFPYFDTKALDAARFFFGTANPEVKLYPGEMTLSEYLSAEDFDADMPSGSHGGTQVIPEGSRNATMSRFAGRVIKKYGDNDTAFQCFMEEAEKYALDLTGCSLEEVLYYVSLGNPVFAMKSDMDAVLVVGYDSLNVTLFNPLDSTVEKMGMEDAGEMFENAGNVFLGYLK